MAREKSYHISRMEYFSRYFILLCLLISGIAVYILNYPFFLYTALITISIIGLVIFEIRVHVNKVTLSRESIVIEMGLISRNSVRINYSSISDIRVKQTVFQRIFGYGDLEIGVPGAHLQQTLNQTFSGVGDVKIEPAGRQGHAGFVLKKFQKVGAIENFISSRITQSRPTHRK